MRNKTVAIIGAGQVGSTLAYSLFTLDICDVLLLNHNRQKAISNVIDIKDCALNNKYHINYGIYDDLSDVDVVVNCAGNSSMLKTRDRNGEYENSTRIAHDILNNINHTSFKGIFINVMNPCDDITYMFKDLDIPDTHVLGTGTSLETNRLRSIVFEYFEQITDSYVVGKHGDFNDVVCKDYLITLPDSTIENLMNLTRNRVWKIYEGKGYTNFGICNIVIDMIKSILFDMNKVHIVSTLCTFNYGITNQCLSLPCRLGQEGITEVCIEDDVYKIINKLYKKED